MKDPTFAGKIKKIREADHITKTNLTENAEVCWHEAVDGQTDQKEEHYLGN